MEYHLTMRTMEMSRREGEVYEIFLDGEFLCRSPGPEYKACRVLEERGLSGIAYFWREGKTSWDIRVGTALGARRAARERLEA